MPRHTRPRPALAPDLEVAAAAFTSREALAVMAALGRVESAMAPQLSADLQMALATVHGHLSRLERRGLIHADTPAGMRRGRTVSYALDRRAVRATLDAMRAALLGDPPAGRPAGTPDFHAPPPAHAST